MSDVALIWNESVADHSKWDDDFRRPDLAPGSAWWGREEGGRIKRLQYICPCGCADWRQVSVGHGEPVSGSYWGWDGNETAPTLTPSIKHIADGADDCTWHGHLTAGTWRGERE